MNTPTTGLILGRNCRFLQSPDGNVEPGIRRKYVDDDSILYLKNMINLRREAQISLINYRRGGQPFMNLLTVIHSPTIHISLHETSQLHLATVTSLTDFLKVGPSLFIPRDGRIGGNQGAARLARHRGVKRIAAGIYEEIRGVLKARLTDEGIPHCHLSTHPNDHPILG